MVAARDKVVLELERLQWSHRGAKDGAVRVLLGMTWPRYVQVVQHLVDDPAAEQYDPQTVRRLQRLREARARRRPSRAAGFDI